MPAGGLVVAGIGALIGGGEALWGAHEKKKYQAQMDALQRPAWKASPYEGQMLSQAESQAGQGMGAASKQAYLNQSQEGLGSSIDALEKGGGSANQLGALYGNYDKGIQSLSIYDDQARQQHINNLMNSYSRQSALADKDYQINQYAPWADKRAALGQQLQGAQNMFQGGLNTFTGGLMGAAKAWGGMSDTAAVTPQAQAASGGGGDSSGMSMMPTGDSGGGYGGGYGGYANYGGGDASFQPYGMRQVNKQQNTWGAVPQF